MLNDSQQPQEPEKEEARKGESSELLPAPPDSTGPGFLTVDGHTARYVNVIFAGSPDARERTHQWASKHPVTGKPVRSVISSLTAGRRHLYTPHLRVTVAVYRLIKNVRPNAEGLYRLDFRDIARAAGMGWHGRAGKNRGATRGNAARKTRGETTPRTIANLLRELRLGGYSTQNVHFDETAGEFINRYDVEPVHILGKLRVEARYPKDPVTGQALAEKGTFVCELRLSDDVQKFLDQDPLPIPDEALTSIDARNDLAPLLLAWASIALSKKPSWERRLDELLVDDLRYLPKAGKPADQKRIVDRALKYIDGARITTGIIRARVEPLVGGGGYKLSVTKEPLQLDLVDTPNRPASADHRHGPRAPWQRRPTIEQRELIALWTRDLLAFGGDERSTVFYTTAARRFIVSGNAQSLHLALGSANADHLAGHIVKSKARAVTAALLREADRLHIPLRRPAGFVADQPEETIASGAGEPGLPFAGPTDSKPAPVPVFPPEGFEPSKGTEGFEPSVPAPTEDVPAIRFDEEPAAPSAEPERPNPTLLLARWIQDFTAANGREPTVEELRAAHDQIGASVDSVRPPAGGDRSPNPAPSSSEPPSGF